VVAAPGAAVVAGAARVVDGDTLVINGETRVRLYGVDAPETKQLCTRPDGSAWTCGVSAGDALRDKVARAGGNVHCVVLNQDRYGRDVALCDAGGDDLATFLVERGWALAYRAYGGSAFAKPEAAARDAKAGVWASAFTPPWEWRAQQRAAKGAK
jgi:endonuclease YncB( thermonuclease family)